MGSTSRRGVVRRRRLAVFLAATALAVTAQGALTAPAGAASPRAADVDFATHCVPPPIAGIPPIDGTTTARIAVDNATPKVGDTVTVTYTVVKPAASNPTELALPADIMTPTGKITLGGAQTGDITVAGPKKNDPVPGRGPFPSFSMTGTFTVTAPGAITLSPGDYNIHTSYILELDTPCTVTNPPAPVSETVTATDGSSQPNTRAISLGSVSGSPGARVTVTGSDFTPGVRVTLAGRAGAAQTADTATATADGQGAFSGALTVNDRATTGVVAYEGDGWSDSKGAGPAAYVVIDDTPVPGNSQKITARVTAGTLSMSQAGDTVDLGSVESGSGGTADGDLRTVTVKDHRGGTAGWSLTGKVTDFTGPGASIPASQLSWTPACATEQGSASTCRAGSAGPVGSAGATLASAPDGTRTGGEFTVDARLSLKVPASTPPGAYAGVLTLTLT
ncbi:beta-xylosidase [Streptomyces bluensis]|uniref:beta-xylosidase n=1 Tax=Streptomyces bluensis TaxID=33897 RepID=UPI0033343A75